MTILFTDSSNKSKQAKEMFPYKQDIYFTNENTLLMWSYVISFFVLIPSIQITAVEIFSNFEVALHAQNVSCLQV